MILNLFALAMAPRYRRNVELVYRWFLPIYEINIVYK